MSPLAGQSPQPALSAPCPSATGRLFLAHPVLECVDLGVQLPGVDQGPQDVVAEVLESQGDTAQVLQTSVDRFDRSVGCADVEVRQDVLLAPMGVSPE